MGHPIRAILLLGALGLALGACWPDATPPGGGDSCNNNGVCEENTSVVETCRGCPGDCKKFCCRARAAYPSGAAVQNPDAATGQADSKFANMAGESSLVLRMEGRITNELLEDFELVGTVSGIFIVRAWDTVEKKYKLLGEWKGANDRKFDLNRAVGGIAWTDQIRIEGTPNAVAKLDAVVALNCQQ